MGKIALGLTLMIMSGVARAELGGTQLNPPKEDGSVAAPDLTPKNPLPIHQVETWGPYLTKIKASLDNLKAQMNPIAFVGYAQFDSAVTSAISLLEAGERIYNEKVMSALFIVADSYLRVKSSVIPKDLSPHFTNGRPELVQEMMKATEAMLAKFIEQGRIEVLPDGRWRLKAGDGFAILRGYSASIIQDLKSLERARMPKDVKEAFLILLFYVDVMDVVEGPDGNSLVSKISERAVTWFDFYFPILDHYRKSFLAGQNHDPVAGLNQARLANLIRTFGYIKNRINFGENYRGRSNENTKRDFQHYMETDRADFEAFKEVMRNPQAPVRTLDNPAGLMPEMRGTLQEIFNSKEVSK